MRISILVPVCNVEKYLRECLDSIAKINLNEFAMEVICLNDGSTDGSLAILEEYSIHDARFKVVDKPNSGYGDTLNVGLSYAQGEYIGIVESDDILLADNFIKLINLADKTEASVIKGNYNLYYDKDEREYFENFLDVLYMVPFNPRVQWKVFLTAPSIWSGIYRRDFLLDNHIYFVPSPGAAYQDTSFMFKVWSLAKSAVVVNLPIIDYRQTNIASSSNSNKKIFNIFSETSEMKSFLQRYHLEELLPLCMRTKFESFAWNLNRLEGGARGIFLAKMYLDARQDFFEGNLVRQYWEDDNWNIIFDILLDCKTVISQNLSCKDEIELLEALPYEDLREKIIWGSETEKLNEKHAEEDRILQVKEKKLKIIIGKTVRELDAEEKDDLIILDKHDKDLRRKIEVLEEAFMNNYIVI